MGQGLKALALIALLAVGAVEPAAATMYRFDLNLGWGFYTLGRCDPGSSCRDAFYRATGVPEGQESGPGSGILIIDDAGLGAITIAIGTWRLLDNAEMNFVGRYPNYTATKTYSPGQLFFDLCGPGVSPPNTVQGFASQAQDFTSCLSSGYGLPGYLWAGGWEVVIAVDHIRYVPEPGTLALMTLGLLGLGFTARRNSYVPSKSHANQ
jgi:hypothetical protein